MERPDVISSLKEAYLLSIGIPKVTFEHVEGLSKSIYNQKGIYISRSYLIRFFNKTWKGTDPPVAILDTLSEVVGYKDWEQFIVIRYFSKQGWIERDKRCVNGHS